MTEFGVSPLIKVDEFAAMGYKIVIFPVTLQRAMMFAALDVLKHLRSCGTQAGLLERMQTRQELYDLMGYGVPAPAPDGKLPS
jgi:methylisocitrate lyase